MGGMNELRGRYASLQSGEWSAALTKPKALDTDAPEAREAAALVAELGFDHFILIFRYVLPALGPVQIVLSNWRTDWYERYWAKGYIQIDPIAARLLHSYRPFDWQDLGPLSPNQAAYFQDARKHGMVDGFSGAVRFGSDQAGFFSVGSEQPRTREEKEHAMGRVLLHTARLYERVQDHMLADYGVAPIALTPRQREALHWTMRGVSRREAGRQMGCSENNFVRHQEAVRRKLGETNNLEAVRKAVAMNLIRPYDALVESEPPG